MPSFLTALCALALLTSCVTTSPQSLGPNQVAKPAPGKPGFVLSPYADTPKLIDVRSVPSGSRVKDPYTSRFFVVP